MLHGRDLRIGQRIIVLHDGNRAKGVISRYAYNRREEDPLFTADEDHPWLHNGDGLDEYEHRHWHIWDFYEEGYHFILDQENPIGISDFI